MALARVIAAAVVLSGLVLAGAPAYAEGPATSLTLGGGNLLPGGAATDYHMDFLLTDPTRQDPAVGAGQNMQISLTGPGHGMFHFLFSPRTQFGVGYDPVYGTNRTYAGLSWDLFSANSVYGQLGFASSFDPAVGGAEASHNAMLAPLMLHGGVELGYRFNDWNSVSLAIDQGLTPVARGAAPESFDNFLLRYGVKF